MVFRVGTAKCVICSILNLLAVGVYLLFFNVTFLNITSENIGFGLIGNIAIACLGIMLPIVIIVFNKKAAKDTMKAEMQ